MKPRFSQSIGGTFDAARQTLQTLTVDLFTALSGGLSFENLPMAKVQMLCTSGAEYQVIDPGITTAYGVQIIETDAKTLTSFKTRIGPNNTIYFTATWPEPGNARLTLVLFGSRF